MSVFLVLRMRYENETYINATIINATITFLKFRDFLMFYQIFLSSQVKWFVVIIYKHGMYELPHELPNDLRLRKSGNISKVSKYHRMIA